MASQTLMPDDRRSLTLRLSVLQYLIAVAFAALAVAFWVFQVAQGSKFAEMAENNHIRRLPLPAPRGIVFDRNGTVLVENQNTFNIALVREQTKNVDATLHALAQATGVDEAQLVETVRRRRREPSYRPLILIENATREQVIAVWARRWELPGVIYQEVPSRKYPGDDLAAHLFGYVSEVSESQLERPEFSGIDAGSIVGQAGVEQAYNRLLMGQEGNREVVVNSVGREIEEVGKQPPVEGRRLQLTIDGDLQKAAEEAFHHYGYNGAAIFLDPRNGEVLALTSLPAFDPNAFATGIDRTTWNALNTDQLHPLQNRALQGRYSPGSLFKVAVATAGLEEGVITPDFKVNCTGGATFYGRFFHCWKREGHGVVDLRHALEQSCNVYFYTVGNMLGVDKIHKWATALGLGEKVGIDLPNEVQGLVPSTEWKRERYHEKWYAGETISVSIGQGQVSVTPLSLAVMAMTVANGGTRYTPHVLKAINEGHGWQPVEPPPPRAHIDMTPEAVSAIRDGLWLVVNGGGTGGGARIPGRDVAGKTGTAQVISLEGARAAAGKTDKDLRDHGWFMFFAPRDHPQIAGVVFVEHGGHGGTYGAPIAKYVLETFFAKQDGRPLPTLPPRPNTVLATAAEDATPAPTAAPGGHRDQRP
jgi:penicillin-binding protein 2